VQIDRMSAAPASPAAMDGGEFAAWVGPHLAVLSAVAARMVGAVDAPDVVQDALLRAWWRRSTYAPDRGSPRAWLLAIVLDRARRHRWRISIERRGRALADGGGSETVIHPSEGLRIDIERAIADLPRRQREVVALYYLADLSVEQGRVHPAV
jgi:RNA polymerase sigma-70 factor, ECF subfamily